MIKKVDNKPYSMSFTTAALMGKEVLMLERLFTKHGNWMEVRSTVLEDNSFQVRTGNASARLYREAKSRLDQLTEVQRALLLTGSSSDQRQLLWLAMCRRYPFIGEFASQVVREKFQRLDLLLTEADYHSFFSDRAAWHPGILQLTEQTREKQRSIVYKSLREAELMDSSKRLQPALLSTELVDSILADDPRAFHYFTISDQEIATWMRL